MFQKQTLCSEHNKWLKEMNKHSKWFKEINKHKLHVPKHNVVPNSILKKFFFKHKI